VRLLLPGELAKHAVSEGTKAVTKYTSSKWTLFVSFFFFKQTKGSYQSRPFYTIKERKRTIAFLLIYYSCYYTVQYSTVQYSTVQYSTVQYNNLRAINYLQFYTNV
jgi:hypothetical protein